VHHGNEVRSTSSIGDSAFDAAEIDREAGAFGRESSFRFREPELVPKKIQEIGGVLAVMDRKGRIKSNLIGIAAQQPGADRMEGAGPAQGFGHTGRALSDHRTDDPLDPPNHLAGGPSRKGHQKDPPWIRPPHDHMRDPMRQRAGLARTGAGNHEDGPAWPSTYLFNAVLYGAAPFRVQPFEMGKRHWSRIAGAGRSPNHDSCFVRNRVFSRVPGLPGPVHPKLRCAGFSDRAPTAGGVPSGGVGAWSSDLSVEIRRDTHVAAGFCPHPWAIR
jgi:hypothetical protein